MTLVHAADLHLSETEADYALPVLDQLIDVCGDSNASFLLLSGDVFDSFDSAEALRGHFRERVARLSDGCRVLMLPGNHDELRQGARKLAALDLGPIHLLDKRPFSLIRAETDRVGEVDIEFVGIPHQGSYTGHQSWDIPEKSSPVRIVLAHGTVPGMTFTGPHAIPDDVAEAGGGLIDRQLFHDMQADYVALGHIHGRRQSSEDGLTLSYAGSTRVWRRGETGEHGAWRVEVSSSGVMSEFVPFPAAGQFRAYELPVDLTGKADIAELPTAEWGRNDWILVHATGVVENEKAVGHSVSALRRQLRGAVRRLDVDIDGIDAMPGIASQPLAERFLSLWAASEPEDPSDRPAWLRARELGLRELKTALAARR